MKRIVTNPLAVFLIACAMVSVFYIDVIKKPNSYLFNDGEDGIKNYYTLLYHAYHSEHPFLLTGMNYPYFEHAIFTDAIPLVSMFVGIFGNPENGVGLLNIILLLSIPLTVLFVYLILKKYEVNNWWSLLAAISIAMLAPQIDRLQGHYGLSFAFMIPFFWWLVLSNEQSGKRIYIVGASVLATISFFLHPYNGLIISSLGLAYFGLSAVSIPEKRKRHLINLVGTGILPVLIFQLFMFMTDPVGSRGSNSHGFFEFFGRIESFIHPRWPHSLFEYFKSIGIEEQPWEGAVYLGFSTILLIVFCLGYTLLNSWKSIRSKIWSRNSLFALIAVGLPTIWIASGGVITLIGTLEFILVFIIVRGIVGHISKSQNSSLRTFALAAGLLVLWGMCIPLKYEPIRPFADYLGRLSEFRSLGRFLWVGYFALTVGAVIWLSRINKRNAILATSVFVLGIGLSAFEWGHRHDTLSDQITSTPNLFRPEEHTSDYRELFSLINEENPDAMVFLPFYYQWSNANEVRGDSEVMKLSMLLSYQSATPMVNINATQLSLMHSGKVLNLFSPVFTSKEMISDIPTGGDIVLVYVRGKQLPHEQQSVLSEAEIIFQNDSYTVARLDLKKRQDILLRESILNEIDSNSSAETPLYDHVPDSVFYYYRSFDQRSSTMSFQGGGAYEVFAGQWHMVDEIPLNGLDTATYEISYYCRFGENRPDRKAWLGVTYRDGSYELIADRFVAESYYSVGDWRRVAQRFQLTQDMTSVRVILNGPTTERPLLIDELLMRKISDAPVFGKSSDHSNPNNYVYNNFWFSASN